MSKPDNRFCPCCTSFYGETYDKMTDFLEKNSHSGCSGIPHSSGEFPYDSKPHCFTIEPVLTIHEKREEKINRIADLIKNSTPEKAAQQIVDRWQTI
jgi:hypothetical protein